MLAKLPIYFLRDVHRTAVMGTNLSWYQRRQRPNGLIAVLFNEPLHNK